MDSQYRDEGYSANLFQRSHGAYLQVLKKGVVVGQVAVGFFGENVEESVQVVVTRFTPGELSSVITSDAFEVTDHLDSEQHDAVVRPPRRSLSLVWARGESDSRLDKG